MRGKALVVDANILVRAVLGKRTRELIETYAEGVSFLVPEPAYAEAGEQRAALVIKRGGDPEKALTLLHALSRLVDLIGSEVYASFEAVARERLPPGSGRSANLGGLHWRSVAQSGQKTPISSAVALPRGPPIALTSFCVSDVKLIGRL